MNREIAPDTIGLHERASATPRRAEPGRAKPRPAAVGTARLEVEPANQLERARPRSLREQQVSFAAVITTPETRDSSIGEKSAAELVVSNSILGAHERLEIYRHGYHARLAECLIDDYPVLEKLLGAERFEGLARAYIAAHPSSGPNLNVFGRHMPEFCRTAELPAPAFAASLATLEWAIVKAIHAPSGSLLTPEELAKVPLETWGETRLGVNPSLTILDLDYPTNGFLTDFRAGKSPATPSPRATHVAVYRTGKNVWRMQLGFPMVALVESLSGGDSLATAMERMAEVFVKSASTERDPGEETSPGAIDPELEAVRKVTTWFRYGVSSGLFSGIR